MRNLGNRSWTSEALQSGRDSTQGVQAAEKPKEQQSGGSMAGALLQERWALGEELGRGAYGQVFRATDRQTGQVVAIKRISLSGVAADHLAKVMSEIELLKSLDHKNIVKYIGSFKTRQHLYIVLEYMDNGAISQIIKPNRFGVFPESVVAVYIAQVLQGLDYLHSQGVVHRDIKGANILTTKEGLVKLCDFGVSSKLSDEPQNARDSYHPDVVGTPYWMAPEVVEMTSVTAASDIWSVGCLMVEMLTGIPPYFDFQPMSALFHIVQDTHPPLPEGITQQGEDFLLKCFQKDAKDRPSAAELLQHEWVHQQRRTLRSTWRSGLAAGLGTAPAASAGKRSDAHESVSSVIKRILQVDGDSQRSEGMVADDHAVHKSLSTPMDPAGSAVPGSATANGRPGTLSLPAGIELADRSARPSSGPAPALAAAAHLPGRPRPATAGEVRAQAKGAGTAAAVEAGAADGIGLPSDSAGPTRAGYMLTAMASGVSGGVLVTPWSLYRTHPPAQLGSAPARADPEAASGSGRSIRDDLESWLRQATDMAVGQGSRPGQLSTMGGSSSRGTGASTGGSDSSGPTHGEDAAAGGTGSSDALDMTQRKRADLAEVRRLIVQLGCSRGSVGAGRTPQGVAATCSALGEVLKRSGGELLSLFMAEMGLVVLLELLQTQKDPDALAGVLELVNSLVAQDEVALEQLCMVGAVPAVMQFCGGKWRLDVRVQAARFLDQLCRRGSHTLQILISCRGLPVLVELVEANPATQMELMQVGVQGIWKVLQAAGPAAMNPLCRLLAAADLVPRLVACLAAVAHRWDGFGGIRNSSSSGRLRHSSSGGGRPPTSPEANSEREQLMGMMSATADLLLLLAHADGTVKLHLCSSTTLEWLFDKVMPLLPRPLQLKVLKTIKRLTTDPQVGGTIEKLVKMVREELKADTPSGLLLDLLLEALQALHNLLKLSRERQTHAARHGLVPQLAAIAQWNVDSENGKMSRRSGPAAVLTAGAAAERPKPTSVLLQAEQAGAPGTSDADKCAALHSLAQSLLCTLAHSTPETRQELWRAHGLDLILEMLAKEAWQIPALDALAAWMVEDVHRVEPKLRMQHSVRLLNVLFSSVAAGLAAHPSSGSAAAEHQSVEKAARLLDIFQRMLETPGASNLCVAVAESELPMTMVTILLIVRTLYEHYPRPKEFIVKFGVADALRKLRAGQASQLVQRRIDTFLSAFRINSVL